jgi:hypothetical protein
MVVSRYILSIESDLDKLRHLEICAIETDVRIYLERRIVSESRL